MTWQQMWRGVAGACAAVVVLACAHGCERAGDAADGGETAAGVRDRVVLYSSVDEQFLRDVVADLEARSELEIEVVTDTEATKTTGLVERLISERAAPRADVWWSSEPFGTVKLEEAGVLAPATVEAAESIAGGWPARLRGADGTWYGFAQRARVIAHHEDRVAHAEAPRTLRELTEPKWRGRVGIARPAFGTTRGHVGALVEAWGEDAFAAWARAMEANGVRVYDGNATVVRAIWEGEIDVGLTDTDDVWSARRNEWPIGMVFEANEEPGSSRWWSTGPLLLPNTVGLVANGPNPEAGRRLMDLIVSSETEHLLAASDSRNIPVFPEVELPSDVAVLGVPDEPMLVDFSVVAQRIRAALAAWDARGEDP